MPTVPSSEGSTIPKPGNYTALYLPLLKHAKTSRHVAHRLLHGFLQEGYGGDATEKRSLKPAEKKWCVV